MSAEKVLETLLQQVDTFHAADDPHSGELTYFRRAIEMEDFPKVKQWIEGLLRYSIFSNEAEIASLEAGYRNRDRIELVVQCCLVMEWSARQGVQPRDSLNMEPAWLFGDIRTLEDVAYSCFRLKFVEAARELRRSIGRGTVSALDKCLRNSAVTWQGMLLIFKAVVPGCSHTLFPELLDLFNDPDVGFPRPAATLFLSFVSDAIHCVERKICPNGEKVVIKLLERGASIMISSDGHFALFKRIERLLPTIRGTWWLDDIRALRCKIVAGKRFSTALRRLLRHRLRREFKDKLSEYTCCSLDSTTKSSRHFPKKLLSLKCLAARFVSESDLAGLPQLLRFFTSKHHPITYGLDL